jgi:hypothetical protein
MSHTRRRVASLIAAAGLGVASAACSASFGSSSSVTISPSGAPYSYRVPDGFAVADKITNLGSHVGTSMFETGVALDEHNLIIVRVYRLKVDITRVPDAAIKSELDAALQATAGSAQLTGQSRQQVDGMNAFMYDFRRIPLTATTTGAKTDYFVFKGRNEVEVACQWVTKPDAIRRGCQQLLASLVVR